MLGVTVAVALALYVSRPVASTPNARPEAPGAINQTVAPAPAESLGTESRGMEAVMPAPPQGAVQEARLRGAAKGKKRLDDARRGEASSTQALSDR